MYTMVGYVSDIIYVSSAGVHQIIVWSSLSDLIWIYCAIMKDSDLLADLGNIFFFPFSIQ